MVVSGVLAGAEVRDGCVVAALAGGLRLGTMSDVRRVLGKLLVEHGRVLVDLTRFTLEWEPAVQVFPTVLRDAGGWPASRMVLFGADERMGDGLAALRVRRSVPVVATRVEAEQRIQDRPIQVSRGCDLPTSLAAARRARSFLEEACADWTVPALLADAALIGTELVTNAIEHTAGPCHLRVSLDDRGLWIEVRDYLPGEPVRPQPRLVGGTGGFGLHVVAALTRRWGTTCHTDGKTVWALVGRPST